MVRRPREVRAGTAAGKPRRVASARTAARAPPTGVSAAQAQVRPRITHDSRRLVRPPPGRRDRVSRARVRSSGIPKAGLPAVRLRTQRTGTTGRPENVAALPRAPVRALVTDPGGRRVRREDQRQAARAAASGPRAVPVRTADPAVRPGPRRATGRGSPRPAATSVAAPGLGAGRAGPPMATAHAAGEKPRPAKTGLRRAVAPAGRASQVRHGPPAPATGATAVTGAQVLPGRVRLGWALPGRVHPGWARPGRVHPGRARARPAARARPGAVVRDPVPAVRQTGRPGARAA